MEQTVICLSMGRKFINLKRNILKIVATPLCLGNISKDWSVDKMKKAGLNGYVYGFSVDYVAITIDDILGIPNYLMKKNNKI